MTDQLDLDGLERPAGHCDDDKAWAEFVRQYDGQPRTMAHVTDFALANRVFMASRDDLDLIVWQTAAKERIRWLSIELAKQAREAERMRGALERIVDLGSDGEHSGDRHARCRGFARQALAPATGGGDA